MMMFKVLIVILGILPIVSGMLSKFFCYLVVHIFFYSWGGRQTPFLWQLISVCYTTVRDILVPRTGSLCNTHLFSCVSGLPIAK